MTGKEVLEMLTITEDPILRERGKYKTERLYQTWMLSVMIWAFQEKCWRKNSA